MMVYDNERRRAMKNKKSSPERECPTACRFCEQAALLDGGNQILCRFHGIVSGDGKCRKFSYDPLKRIPHAPLRPPKLSEEDLLL